MKAASCEAEDWPEAGDAAVVEEVLEQRFCELPFLPTFLSGRTCLEARKQVSTLLVSIEIP